MKEVASQKMLPIREAIRMATGQEISTVSAWRYCNVGSNGVVLRHWSLGSKKLTTVAEVLAWMESVSNHGKPEKTASRVRRSKDVDAQLDEEFA